MVQECDKVATGRCASSMGGAARDRAVALAAVRDSAVRVAATVGVGRNDGRGVDLGAEQDDNDGRRMTVVPGASVARDG